MTNTFWIPLVATFLVALCAPMALRPLLQKAGVLDVPNERSSHEVPVIRGGGLAQAVAMTVGLGIAITLTGANWREKLIVLLSVAFTTAALGWVEDYKGVPIIARAGVQFAIGMFAIGTVAILDGDPLVWAAVGGIAFIGLINVVNFMDGINGISAFHGIVAGCSFVTLGILNDQDWMIIAGIVLAVAYAAFLPWNLAGRMFLGDAGSYLLGGFIAAIIVLGWMDGVSLLALAAPMLIYVADTGTTLVGRIVDGERWYEAHRDHTYQRLVRCGFSHLTVSSTVALSSACAAALGVLFSEATGVARTASFVGLALIVICYTLVRFKVRAPQATPTRLESS